MKRLPILLLILISGITLFLAGCGGGGGGSSTGGGTGVGILAGRVVAPDGSTPISGARVYIPSKQESAQTETTTGADGTFTLTNCPTGAQIVKITKGSFSAQFNATVVQDSTVNVPTTDTTLNATSARIAVVLGSYDSIEDVLCKLGYGHVDDTGKAVMDGTQKFDVYSGVGEFVDPSVDVKGTMDDLVSSSTKLDQYDIIFLNCGAELENFDLQDTATAAMRAWVTGGGSLYVTDLASAYLEPLFPAAIDWQGSDSTPADQEEPVGTWFLGDSGITTEADVLDANLKTQLKNSDNLTSEDKLHIEGFLGGWAVIKSVPDTTKIWVTGDVTYSDPFDFGGRAPSDHFHHGDAIHGLKNRGQGVVPLTVSFTQGNGRVIYSSYHTVEGESSVTLRPQEKLLGLLVFEL
ncbi:MAG: carboxypeptidase regulatory-like domain-containing protein [Armatimonadetes bacterium]|nr:carboxypeptidase regulatory-like domain-containing protein [Armatimonadota bacterium]